MTQTDAKFWHQADAGQKPDGYRGKIAFALRSINGRIAGGSFASRLDGSAALIAAAVVWLGAFGWFGYGYLHYRQAALRQQAAMQQTASANLALQRALDHLRDRTQARLQQLQAERNAAARERANLRARIGELERKFSSGQSPEGQHPLAKAAPPRATPATATRAAAATAGTPAAAPAAAAAGHTQHHRVAAISPAVPGTQKNFTPPAWVPAYFANEKEATPDKPSFHASEVSATLPPQKAAARASAKTTGSRTRHTRHARRKRRAKERPPS